MKNDSQKSSPPDLIRWYMLTRRARTPVEAFASRRFGTDDGKNKKIGSRTPTDAIRILPRLSAERRTSIGVPPRFSPQGVFHRKGLSLRPCFLGRGGDTFCASL